MNTPGNRLLLAPVLLALLAARPLAAQSDSSRTAEVHTEATATRSVRPDLASFTLTLTATDTTVRDAGRAVASRVAAVRRALEKLGIPHDSMATRSAWWWWPGRMTIEPQPTRHLAERLDSRGVTVRYEAPDTLYRSNDVIEVRLHDLTKIGPAIDSAYALGVTQISPVSFQATDVSTAVESALREATDRARRRATAIAEAAGGRLGRTILLSTEPESGYPQFRGAATTTVTSGDHGTEVVAPLVTVTVTVHGRWELLRDH